MGLLSGVSGEFSSNRALVADSTQTCHTTLPPAALTNGRSHHPTDPGTGQRAHQLLMLWGERPEVGPGWHDEHGPSSCWCRDLPTLRLDTPSLTCSPPSFVCTVAPLATLTPVLRITPTSVARPRVARPLQQSATHTRPVLSLCLLL